MILAGFENDFLVRDPDVCIAGTEIISQGFGIGETITLDNPFKITGSVDVLSPDNNQVVGTNPAFSWIDDSSEDQY